jgi:NDP-sugar pyrophosphorylase family protein
MIIIPMAGLSHRFANAGYDCPKYMLKAHNKTLFHHTVKSFKAYFKTEAFLFILRDVHGAESFVRKEVTEMGINNAIIIVLDKPTLGQADTVYKGLIKAKVSTQSSLTIFNIDTIRNGFHFPKNNEILNSDGYLEVFYGTGDNWSFVRPESADSTRVIETAEKKPISNLCSTGLYYFRNIKLFFNAFLHAKEINKDNELYVAPLYNYLIQQRKNIRYQLIERNDVIFCGVPEEYHEFIRNG